MDRHDRLPGLFSFKILQIQLKSPYRIPIGNPLGFWDFPSFSSTRGSWSAPRPRNLRHVFKQCKLVIKTCPWRIFDKMVTRRKKWARKSGGHEISGWQTWLAPESKISKFLDLQPLADHGQRYASATYCTVSSSPK